VLRPGNTHASHGALAVLKRLIKKLKKAYPGALILFRADAGFAVPALYRYLERQEIRYVIDFITNRRLLAQTATLLLKARRQCQETGEKQRLFTSFNYQAESWTRPRRIIAKVEYTQLGANQRFVVTNLVHNPKFVYDDIYVLRGDVENRIKELKLELKADRLSCHRFLANQFRLLLHTAAYCLFWLLRHYLQGTELATAQVNTLRLKLLKIGARLRETSCRIWGTPGLGLSSPRPVGPGVTKPAGQSRLIALPPFSSTGSRGIGAPKISPDPASGHALAGK
jgi:hypothetical protein